MRRGKQLREEFLKVNEMVNKTREEDSQLEEREREISSSMAHRAKEKEKVQNVDLLGKKL